MSIEGFQCIIAVTCGIERDGDLIALHVKTILLHHDITAKDRPFQAAGLRRLVASGVGAIRIIFQKLQFDAAGPLNVKVAVGRRIGRRRSVGVTGLTAIVLRRIERNLGLLGRIAAQVKFTRSDEVAPTLSEVIVKA